MGILHSERDYRYLTLAAEVLIGRSSACMLRLREKYVSGEHARLTWLSNRWTVRDLASHNGTYLNGERIPAGETITLSEGDTIAFGNKELSFRLIDASAPEIIARRISDGVMLSGDGGLLTLPNEDKPLVCVLQDASGRWVVEREGIAYQAEDGETIQLAEHSYVLHLPQAAERTADARASKPDMRSLALSFRVSRDEEQVEVTATIGQDARVFAPRAHYYSLLTLARHRLEQEQRGHLPEDALGWINVDALLHKLASSEGRLNVEICRTRKDFSVLPLRDATAIIERRKGRRQLRIGCAQLAVETMS